MSEPTQELVRYEVIDEVALLTLNRPEKRNAFNTPMTERWLDCLERAHRDDAVRVIVITGAGKAFCSGGDVDEMGSVDEQTPLGMKERLFSGVQRLPRKLAAIDKPLIAAINGVAAGAGLDFALRCDIRFMAEGARVAETYGKLGLVPGAGGTWLLPRLVGVPKALEMFWTSDFVDAAEALRIGLVNKVFADAELLDATMAFAKRIAQAAPLSVRLIKRAVYQGTTIDFETSLDLISSHMTIVRGSRDHAEAVAAFSEKRAPRFEGK